MKESAPYGHLANLLRDCCAELVLSLAPEAGAAASDEAAQERSPSPPGSLEDDAALEVASFVELGGSSLRALVVASLSVDFLRATHPRRHRGVTPQDLLGWASELVNQMAGRLVNKLGRRGISVQIGIPGSLMGREIRLWFPFGDDRVFGGEGLRVSLSLEAISADFDLPSEDQDGSSQEGDLLLF